MARNTNLETILFPVNLDPIHLGENEGVKRKKIPRYRAVVRKDRNDRNDRNEVLSIVSLQYELLLNSKAIEMGKAAFNSLFPDTAPENFKIYDIKTTRSGSACAIDLIDPAWRTDVWEQETWLPFLRVSNSYNRSRALTFDFGFVRKLCENGMIFNKKTVRAKYTHTRGNLDIDFASNPEFRGLKSLEQEFIAHLRFLNEIEVKKAQLPATALYFLDLNFNLSSNDLPRKKREAKRFTHVSKELLRLTGEYHTDQASNLYTALNIATDFASHSARLAGNFATPTSLQDKVGKRSRLLHVALSEQKVLEELIKDQLELFN
ncbi:MAG: DUF932 domain-containing protein [Opitutaceae bacterium]